MRVRSVHDRDELAELLQRDQALHAYEIGDLDNSFWPYTSWYRHGDSLALLYSRNNPPTLLVLGRAEETDRMSELVEGLIPLLPRSFYAHLSAGLAAVLTKEYEAESYGPHLKMALTDVTQLELTQPASPPVTEPLSPAHLPELTALYAASYPGSWFDQQMLETGQYVGVRRDGELLAVAGVHVWSPAYGVAALGNVTTHPSARGEGLARAAVGSLCRRLLHSVDHIGLNVRADNPAAIAVYTRLGFTPIGEYAEFLFTARPD
jgi:RimJ/RimL family protein N-acetyltransferase